MDSSGGVQVDFYGKFPTLHIPHSRLPLEAETVCRDALKHLRVHMIRIGLARDEPAELSPFHLPIFGLFKPGENLWLSPGQEIKLEGSEKLRLHFRIRFVWMEDRLESLKPGTMHYLYLQCHDDFVNDRIKMMFPTKLEEKGDLVRGMLVMGMVCPQLDCGKEGSKPLPDVFTKLVLENSGSAAGTSNGAVTTSAVSNGTSMTDSSGMSNGHTSAASTNQLIPQSQRESGIVTHASAHASAPATTKKEVEKIMKHACKWRFWSLKNRLPASLRGPYSKPWDSYQLYTSVKDHLPTFLQDYREFTVSRLMATYIRGIRNLVPSYGYETYTAQAKVDEDPFEEVHVGLRDYQKGLRGLIFGQKRIGNLSHFANIKYEPHADGEAEVTIQRRQGKNTTLKFDSKSTAESFISMVQGWYRLEVNFTHNLCPKLSSKSQRLMTALQAFGPMSAKEAEELLGGQLHQENPPFLICQKMEDPWHFRILSLDDDKKPVHAATLVVSEAKKHFKVFSPNKNDEDAEITQECTESVFDSKDDSKDVRQLISAVKEKYKLRTFVKQQKYRGGIMHLFSKEHKGTYGVTEEETICRVQTHIGVPEVFEFGCMTIENKLEEGPKTVVEKAKQIHNEKSSEVALKRLKEGKDTQYLQPLLAAADKMRKLRGASFINFLGLTTNSADPHTTYVVLELAPLGDLEHFLKGLAQPQSLQVTMSLALQIAQAGSFLERHRLVHGNLRCRSVLIMMKNLNRHCLDVKIGDPGLVSVFNKKGLKDPYNMERLPWIAGERLSEGSLAKETLATEVFSYGTLLFELVSQAKVKPHETHNISSENDDRIRAFYKNPVKQPIRPVYTIVHDDDDDEVKMAKNALWDMIEKCHNINPSDRPTFEDLIQEMHRLALEPQAKMREHMGQTAETQAAFSAEEGSCEDEVDKLNVDPDRIKCENGKQLGAGFYGEVKLGKFYPPTPKLLVEQQEKGEMVAVKKLKEDRAVTDDFEHEVSILLRCKHPHIVEIKAVVRHPVNMIVMEYMEKGSLLDFVKHGNPEKNPEKSRNLYIRICLDVTEGMLYLASRRIVHRDLSARNVLLTGSLRAKIADFGLSKAFRDKDYYAYTANSSKQLPIFWLAPECMQPAARFSEKSDVWSFGVLMWEIFSGGKAPGDFLEVNGEAAFQTLFKKYEKGDRLKKPTHCDLDLHNIMKHCWDMDVTVRSSFQEIRTALKNLQQRD